MIKKYPLQEIVGDVLLAWLFSFSLLWSAFSSLQYTFSVGRMAVYTLLFALLWILFLRVPWTLVALSFFLFCFVFFWLLPTVRDPERLRSLLTNWNGFWWWVWRSAYQRIPNPPQGYLNWAVLLMSLGTAVLTGLLARIRIHPLVFLLLGGGLFFAQETFLHTLNAPAFILFLCAFALYTLRQSYIGRRRRVQKAAPPLRFLAGALPLCLLAALLAAALPTREIALGQPVIDWVSGWNVFNSIGDGISVNFSFGGLKKRNGNDELGGPLRANNTLLLRLRAERAPYLRGHVYDTYTGRAWTISDESYTKFSRLERITWAFSKETLSGESITLLYSLPGYFFPAHGSLLEGYDLLSGAFMEIGNRITKGSNLLSPPLDSLFEERLVTLKPDAVTYRTQQITFENIRSNTLFLPGEAVDLLAPAPIVAESDWLQNVNRSALGDMRLSAARGSGFTYAFETCSLNLSRAEMGDLLRLSGEWLYAEDTFEILDGMHLYARSQAELALGGGLSTDSAVKPSVFLQLPDTLPQRVYDLAEELTADLPTDYDKALTIETYLSANFPYDLEVPRTPADRDFVDYFLFDLQRGYCTYYATAMAALCRAAGLPARYVEGFVPASDAPGQYYVSGEQAHAWCEVFFSGFGWVTFEPTASFGEDFERRYFGGESTQSPVDQTPAEPTPDTQTPVSPLPDLLDGSEKTEWTPPDWLWALLAMLGITLGLPALHAFRRARLRRGVFASGRSIEIIFARAVILARCLGASPPVPSETPLEWARKADEKAGRGSDARFTALAGEVCRLRYGPDRIMPKNVRKLFGALESLTARHKPDIAQMRYVLYRYYFGTL